MLILPHETAGDSLDADVAIFGAGVAGITLARALDDGKRRILLLEGGGLELSDTAQSLFVTRMAGLPVDTTHSRYRAFGGTSYMWTGRTAPLDPIDFAPRAWVPDSGWPIDLEALREPYLRAMASCGFEGDWQAPPPQLASVAALPSRPEGIQPHVWRFWAMSRESYQHWGDAVYEHVRRSANLHAVLGADVVGIESDGSVVTGARVRRADGVQIPVTARRFVLCCGGIENARLLLNFGDDNPALLGAVAPVAGRYFMQHPRAPTATIAADARQSARLQTLLNRFTRPRGLHYETGVAITPAAQERLGLVNASAILRYARRRPDSRAHAPIQLGRAVQTTVRKLRGHEPMLGTVTATLILDLEQIPDRESRIALVDERDAIGLRTAVIDWRLNPPERRTAAWLSTTVAEWIASLGLGTAHLLDGVLNDGGLVPERMLDSYHHLGATRMSATPATGVVDADLRVHGTANLYICGGSVMPTGGHANPTLTIAALAHRLADHLASVS